jgi:hypothetical protein
VGFEPTETHKTSTVFETVPFVHSGILPGGRLAGRTGVAFRQCFLKTPAVRADASCVADTNLFPDEARFTPRPAWQVIEQARRRYLTGELTLPTTPATRIFLRDGLVYLAERTTDGTLPIRLMMEGVITRDQIQRGTVIVNGVEHVGRLFDMNPTIDRASVELCVELFTDDVMIAVANTVVSSYELVLYRRHPSGIDRWYPHSVPVTGRHGESQTDNSTTTRPTDAVSEAKVAAKPKPKVEVQPAPAEVQPAEVQPAEVQPAEVRAEVQPVQPAEVKAEAQPVQAAEVPAEIMAEATAQPQNRLNAPPITQAVPVIAPAATNVPPPPPITQAVPVTSGITTQVPVTSMPAPTAQIPVTPPALPASTEVDASVIADEVAEAIKRAFAGMGAGL